MRFKILLFVCLVGAVLSGCYLALDNSNSVAEYSPREEKKLTTEHEGAVEIMKKLRGNIETGEVNDEDYVALERAVKKYNSQAVRSKNTDWNWGFMGPDNIGGRTRDILIVDELTLYSGGVSGGLWKTVNGGNNWTRVENFPNAMVTSIALTNNGTYYVGTGSQFDGGSGEGGSGFRGRGVYRSTDGENFTVIPDTDPGVVGSGDWTFVDALVADPNADDRVYFGGGAGYGYIEGENVFEGIASGLSSSSCEDIAIANDGSYMLVMMDGGRLYKSDNNTFTSFSQRYGNGDGETPQSSIGRGRVKISEDDPSIAYTCFASSSGFFGGAYYSSDNGDFWSEIWPGGSDQFTPLPRNQGIYDLALGIEAGNPGVAYVGGIEVWKCGPDQQAERVAFSFDFPGAENAIHADIHEITFSPEGMMYVTCDGGIYRSESYEEFVEINRGFNITQYYGIAYTPGDGVIGGTQDNGTHLIPNDGSLVSDLDAIEIFGGDGFDCAVSQVTYNETGIAFVASQNGGVARFSSDGAGGQFWDDDIIALLNEEGEIGQFYTCLNLFENTEDEDSQQKIALVNPWEETITDSTFTVSTAAQNLPFEYTLAEGEELGYWAELIREELTLEEELTEDPNYFWLDPQDLTEILVECDSTSEEIGTEIIIDEIIPIDSCFTINDSLFCVTYDYDTTFTEVPVLEWTTTCDSLYYYAADTLLDVHGQIEVTDPYTSIFAVGFVGSQGVWITRDGTNFNTNPDWWRVMDAPGGGAKAIEYSPDGKHMYVSGWNGSLTRVSNLHQVWSEDDLSNLEIVTMINNAGAAVTGVAVDINDPEHVVVTVGGYGNTSGGKVQETFNALDEVPSWNNVWFNSSDDLATMPCYDVIIDFTDDTGNTFVVGTEYGIYATDDGGDTWVPSNAGMENDPAAISAPVFSVEQQWRTNTRWSTPLNSGAIYAGTHGRGIFRADESFFVSVEEPQTEELTANDLVVYPNPVQGNDVWVDFNVTANERVIVEIYTLNGRLVSVQDQGQQTAGIRTFNVDASTLSNGNYIMKVSAGDSTRAAKFIVMR